MPRIVTLVPLVASMAFALSCDRPTAPARAALASTPPLLAAAPATSDVQRSNDRVDFDHVATGCNGEAVLVRGRAHSVSAVATDGNIATVRFHFNTQNVTGVDVASGATYQFNEVYKEDGSVTFVPPAIDERFVGHFRLIGRGSLDNMLIDAIYDVSFDPATQQPSFAVVKLDARCRG